jgi:hypothetical protein
MDIKELTPEGRCPTCGSADLLLAVDRVAYTPASKNADGTWDLGGTSTEDLDSGDPAGSTRLFCVACGEYFTVPPELQGDRP